MAFESWQVFNVANKNLVRAKVQQIFRRATPLVNKWGKTIELCLDCQKKLAQDDEYPTKRFVDLWAANPSDCNNTRRNPIDCIRDLLDALDDVGKTEYARAAIDYMAKPLGGRFTDIETSKSDKKNIDSEIADISIALGDLASRIREARIDGVFDTAERIRIKDSARTIKQEVEQLLDAAGIEL